MRRIPFKHTFNLRDLGGIPISLYHQTKYRQFIRSDAIIELEEEEIDFLIKYGVKVIIDLRNNSEIEKRPNCLQDNADFIYLSLPFLNETKMEEDKKYKPSSDLAKKDLLDIYIDIIDNYQCEIKTFFDFVLQYLDYGIAFHCSAGKDRTGILAAMILLLAGVNILDILADYEISFTYLSPRTDKLRALYPDLPMHIMESKRENMAQAIAYLIDHYQTIENYFLTIGLSKKQIELLRNKIA